MTTTASRSKMPTFFLPHGGGPCFFMDWNPRDTWTRLQAFLKDLARSLPERPKAIVAVSAHWRTDNFAVSSAARPDMIYDYYGFPDHSIALAGTHPESGQLHIPRPADYIRRFRETTAGVAPGRRCRRRDAEATVLKRSIEEKELIGALSREVVPLYEAQKLHLSR